MRKNDILVRKAKKGDLKAFEELVSLYQNRVYFHCYQLTGSYDDAQDLAQEVFISVFKSLKSFRQEADFGTWVRRITVNHWINTIRRKKLNTVSIDDSSKNGAGELVQEIAAGEESPLEMVENDEFYALVRSALMKMAPEFRSVLVLRDVEGYSYEEMAAMLGCSLGTVKSRLSRARRNMREEIKALSANDGDSGNFE